MRVSGFRLLLGCFAGVIGLALAGCNQIDAQPDGAGAGSDPTPALLERAEGGDITAQLSAGRFYRTASIEAEGAERARRESEALRWLTLAAEQENAEAQAELGIALATAEGQNRNVAEARRWLGRAGQAGQASAYFMLGELSQTGEGAAPNPVMAVGFWKKAASLGHTGSLHRLAEAHEQGLGVDPDIEAALGYYHGFTKLCCECFHLA